MINIEEGTGNSGKAEHGSKQGPIGKQEHKEWHTTDSDSNAQHTGSTAEIGEVTEGQPTDEAQCSSAPSNKERDDTATTITQAGQEEEAIGEDDSADATTTGSAGPEQASSGDSESTTSEGTAGKRDMDKPSAQVETDSADGQPITEAKGRPATSDGEGCTATTTNQAGQEEEATGGKDDSTEATRTGSAGSEKPPSDESRSTASDSTKGEDTITEPEEQRQQSDPGGEEGQIYRGVYEAAYMVATTLGTGKYTAADIFEMVMDNHPNIEDVTHGKQQLLVVQYAIINALKDAEAVGKIRMCGKSKME
jgi:hypothetical protein